MATEADVPKQSNPSPEPSTNQYVIKEIQLGVWKAVTATPKRDTLGRWRNFRDTSSLIIRLFVDVYRVSPRLLSFLFLSKCWHGIGPALGMRLENIISTQIELAISTKQVNVYPALFAICCKVLHSAISYYAAWSKEYVKPELKDRLKHHFQVEKMKADLKTDLPTSAEMQEEEVTPDDAWSLVNKTFKTMQYVVEIFSQLLLLRKVSRMNLQRRGNILYVIFLIQAIVAKFSYSALWKFSFLAYINNDDYKRAKSLQKFAKGRFRQEIISNNLADWIVTEYKKAFAALGNTSTLTVYRAYNKKPALFGFIEEISRGIPFIFFAIMGLTNPQHMSVSSIVTLQSSGRALFYAFIMFFFQIQDIHQALNTLERMYTPKRSNLMKDGTLCLTETVDTSSKGMALVLKDVSFAYPGSGKKTNALKEINLDIKAGQLVVIVGANGSGKSTLIRILSRLYDPSLGNLLVDGRPSTDYRVADLHRATALLSQDSQVYPLTLAENIGLGYPDCSSDLDMIKEAAKEGGAAEFIEDMEKGYETMLETFDESFHMNLNGNRKHPLWVMSDKMKKKSDVSGGQRQRVVAARTFMRFKSGKVKLVIVDEPSSALDADGELQLFQNLISAREGKTMVFVTHRFGHLTKYADQIICMKDGMIVEIGDHQELMSAAGEYAKLYKLQADAFSNAKDPDG